MSHQNLRIQQAARRGIYIMRSMDNSKKWDNVDACGPCGLQLTKRQAINRAVAAASKSSKVRMYGTDAAGKWHRVNCEVIASRHVASTPCNCSRLIVKH